MLFILLFLFIFGCIVYYVVNLLLKKRITENFVTTPENNLTINDSHYFLTTSILPGKQDIASLREKNPKHTDFFYVDDNAVTVEQTNLNVVSHRPSKLSYPTIKPELTCIKENHPIRKMIGNYQPYIFDQPEIDNYYDYPFYRDWRYPERPIDIRFSVNPKQYCANNPHVYPCYKYYSKW